MQFLVDNPGQLLEGAVIEFAAKLGSGIGPGDVTLVVDDEVGSDAGWAGERREEGFRKKAFPFAYINNGRFQISHPLHCIVRKGRLSCR